MADLTGIGPGTTVLDVGCGSGSFCALAAERGAVVHGIDAMPERVAEARRRVPGGDFRVELMEQLPWPADNDFFAFIATLEPDRLRLEGLPEKDLVARAIERLELDVVAAGDAPAVMELPDDEALAAALTSRGRAVRLARPDRRGGRRTGRPTAATGSRTARGTRSFSGRCSRRRSGS